MKTNKKLIYCVFTFISYQDYDRCVLAFSSEKELNNYLAKSKIVNYNYCIDVEILSYTPTDYKFIT